MGELFGFGGSLRLNEREGSLICRLECWSTGVLGNSDGASDLIT
jgi:hypothetical protein